jgi:hypothetical protein
LRLRLSIRRPLQFFHNLQFAICNLQFEKGGDLMSREQIRQLTALSSCAG